jgi:hypothetical protein
MSLLKAHDQLRGDDRPRREADQPEPERDDLPARVAGRNPTATMAMPAITSWRWALFERSPAR